MNATLHPLALSYLREVERGIAPLPRGRRDEVLTDLREHLDASLAGAETEADVRNVLDRLGDPRDVAAAARSEAGVGAPDPRPVMEWWAVFLISAGSLLLPILGWLAGIAMVWTSRIWQPRHKVMATLLVPFGWMGAFLLWALLSTVLGDDCTTTSELTVCTVRWASSPVWWTLTVVAVVGPFVSTLVLLRALIRHRRATAL